MESEEENATQNAGGATIIDAALIRAGGNVNLTILGDANVSAGEGGVKFDCSQKFARLCNVVNKQTHRTISAQITGHFKNANLCEPNFKVYPQMRKVRNFFKGGYENLGHETQSDNSQSGHGSQQRKVRNQIRKEVGFYYQGERDRDETITKDEIVTEILSEKSLRPQDENPVTAVVASAGSGKTTLLRRIAEDVLNSCSIYCYEGKPEVEESHLKMVYFKDMKHMRFEGKLKPAQFLFEGLYANDDDADKAYKWLLEHENEAVLIFDGLDQATFTIDDESSEIKLNPYQKGTASEIMCNILSRNLLPHAKIVIASREFKVSELPADAHPDDIISLVGFKIEDAEKLFIALVIDHGTKIWEDIKKLSPRLLNILSVPVFLVLTAAIMARNPNVPPPTTITELYNRILLSLPRVDNIREKKQIMEVIKKLKAMAHQGMVEGRVVFYQDELVEFGLSIQDARDLMIKVPGNQVLSRHLLEGEFDFFFCHQSFQEFLSASFIVEMKYNDFSAFNNSHLHQSRWSVVRTFVSGIIHDITTSELHSVSDPELKRNVFDQAIPAQIENEQNGVGLLAAIYESADDNLVHSLPRMPSMSGSRIGPNEAYMYGSILSRRGGVREKMVDMYDCGLNDENVETIVHNMKLSKISVDDLDLKFNSFSVKGLNSLLTHFDSDRISIEYGRVSEFRYGLLNWNNIRKISWGSLRKPNWSIAPPRFEMVNEDKTIVIDGLISGSFIKVPKEYDTKHASRPILEQMNASAILVNIQRKRLSLGDGLKSQVLDLLIFFEQEEFIVKSEDHVYVTAAKMTQMKSLNMKGMVKKKLLDCRSKKHIDSTVITSCVQTFKTEVLDILVNYNTSFVPANFLSKIGDNDELRIVDVNIHWWFKLHDFDDVRGLIKFVNKNHVESIRLQCHEGVELKDIRHIIESCKIKRLSMKYWNSSMSKNAYNAILEDVGSMTEFAMSHSVEYEFNDPRKYTDKIKDAWEEADRRKVD